ncbi:MAG: hypothetical protein PHO56_01150 [Patescibacteria group bacterium]|nr:hypothetical protein [Patescibacteria group bacterium]
MQNKSDSSLPTGRQALRARRASVGMTSLCDKFVLTYIIDKYNIIVNDGAADRTLTKNQPNAGSAPEFFSAKEKIWKRKLKQSDG